MTEDAREDSPGIRVLPPLVVLACFGLGGLADRVRPWPIAHGWTTLAWLRWAGLALVAAGVALDLWSLRLFTRHGTSALPFRPASAFVARGPYRFTRNPMYLGMTLTLAGVGLALGRTWIVLAAALAAAILDRYAIRREERYLERRFGADYLGYKRRVRRWL
ncbi:MAG: isoprenylcysteine carboxylmethyltransferase family protein [Thermoanaerobaculia bacterium]|nr:MAG: isoprenylcysteine carboxylmethyltransferase family protein [Thermoanaerobaculia bacterium]